MRVLITGASRGIGAAVARVFAQHHGSDLQVALLGRSKSRPSHAALEGTLLDTARDVERCGGTALAVHVDMRDGDALRDAMSNVLHSFGGMDVLVNNASVLVPRASASAKQMDLLHSINTRGSLLCIDECRKALEESRGSIVTLSPPIQLGRLDWISAHPAYTISKYSMTLATLGAASVRVRANCIWPARTVATAATLRLEQNGSIPGAHTNGRPAEMVAEAVHRLATKMTCNAATLLDEEIVDFGDGPNSPAPIDAFVDEACIPRCGGSANGLACF